METLDDMRQSIDNIDNAIIAMLAERFKVTDRVGLYKAENGLQAKDHDREAKQHQRITELATQYGVDPHFARAFLTTVIDCVVDKHKAIAHA